MADFLDFSRKLWYNSLDIMDKYAFTPMDPEELLAWKGRRFLKRRLLAAVLSLLLILSAVRMPAEAAGNKEEQIKNQLITVYHRALRRAGKASFIGFCASAVNNQLYYLGIETNYRGCNAKDLFNRYQRGGVTSGGYPVRPYPGSGYTLESALNEISANGNRDVYNILVGFQRATSSDAGYRYGHAVLIYAILNGIVYFAECCPVMVNGYYCPEGLPISCSIQDFCNHYNSFTVLDGVVWFGNNTYVEQCTGQNISMDGMTLKNTQLLTDIPGTEDYETPQVAVQVPGGSIVQISRMYETPEGDRWYEAQWEDGFGYMEASAVKTLHVEEKQITVGADNVHMPSYLRKGRWLHLGGQIHAGDSSFGKVQIRIHYRDDAENAQPVYAAEMQVDGKIVVLSQVAANGIHWYKLPQGDFRMTILAEVRRDVWNGSGYETITQERELWRSEFQVVTNNKKIPEVTFDACGGDSALERTAVQKGEPINQLPEAKREGHTFLGWFTEPEGGQKITEETLINANVTYYAHWAVGAEDHTGWLKVEEDWVYYRKGVPARGWFYYNGKRFWQEADGTKPKEWKLIDGKWYYFTQSGAAYTGWLETEHGCFYLKSDGTKVSGWITIQGQECCFDIYGKLIRQL